MRRDLAICTCLALITIASYARVGRLEFVYFDDPGYVLENMHVHKGLAGESIWWALTFTHEQSNWHPLTWWSHMLDIELGKVPLVGKLFGFKTVNEPNPAGPHLVNLMFHVCNTLLLFLVLRWMTRASWRSAVVAALFAVHPMHVESVAWVAERKDLLSTFLGLVTICAYLWYVERLKETEGQPPGARFLTGLGWYVPIFLIYTLALMAKPMMVTLWCLLLLLDYWPLGRLSWKPAEKKPATAPRLSRAAQARLKQDPRLRQQYRQAAAKSSQFPLERLFLLVLEKVPLMCLAIASCIFTWIAQKTGGSMASEEFLPFPIRISNVLTAYVRYIGDMFWPADLAIFYPFNLTQPLIYVVGAALILVLLSCAAVAGAMLGKKYLAVGWFWFVGTLVPVIGFVQVGDQSMADRYSYLPFCGLFIALVWGAADLLGQWRAARIALGGVALAIVAVCAVLTARQVEYWQNSILVLEHTLDVAPDNPAAHNNLGVLNWEKAEGKRGKKPDSEEKIREYRKKAMEHWHEAVRIRERFSDAWNNLGCAYRFREKGMSDEDYHKQLLQAVECFEKAIFYKPEHADGQSNLALTQWELRTPPRPLPPEPWREGEALKHFTKALEIRFDHLDARVSLATVLARLSGEYKQEEPEKAAARLREAAAQLGKTLSGGENPSAWLLQQAAEHLNFVVNLDPYRAHAFAMLGEVCLAQGKTKEAVDSFLMAAWIMATCPVDSMRNGPGAVNLASRAVQVGGESAVAMDALAAAWAEVGEFPRAVAVAQHGIELAEKEDDPKLAAAIRARLELYKTGRKFRDQRTRADLKLPCY